VTISDFIGKNYRTLQREKRALSYIHLCTLYVARWALQLLG